MAASFYVRSKSPFDDILCSRIFDISGIVFQDQADFFLASLSKDASHHEI
jgi:hypothetical protein